MHQTQIWQEYLIFLMQKNWSGLTLVPGTVADNVRYGPQLQGKKLTDAEVQSLLSLADLDPALCSKPASELSVGQAQRVALARTLANDPEACWIIQPFRWLQRDASWCFGFRIGFWCWSVCAGASAGWADERVGSHLDAEHRGGDRAAEEDEGAHHGDGVAQREADPADRRPGLPPRRRRGRRGAPAVGAVRGQAPHGTALPRAQLKTGTTISSSSVWRFFRLCDSDVYL